MRIFLLQNPKVYNIQNAENYYPKSANDTVAYSNPIQNAFLYLVKIQPPFSNKGKQKNPSGHQIVNKNAVFPTFEQEFFHIIPLCCFFSTLPPSKDVIYHNWTSVSFIKEHNPNLYSRKDQNRGKSNPKTPFSIARIFPL